MKYIITSLTLASLTACANGGVGIEGSPIWYSSASPEAIAAYNETYCDDMVAKDLVPSLSYCMDERAKFGANPIGAAVGSVVDDTDKYLVGAAVGS